MLLIYNNINADIKTELAKRGYDNAINVGYFYYDYLYSLYMENGYLIAEFRQDGSDEASIIAYQISNDTIKLIVRVNSWDFAYRTFDRNNFKDRTDHYSVAVHDYYLVEFFYINGKLEIYNNRIMDINTNGYIFNELKIGSNVNNLPHDGSIAYSGGFTLKEGMNAKIISMTRDLKNVVYGISAFDYDYFVLIENRNLFINGWFLDFNNRIKLF
jgi:hypothetical protein